MDFNLWPIAWAIFGSVCAVCIYRYETRRPYRVSIIREIGDVTKTIEAEGTTPEEVNAILDAVTAAEIRRNTGGA